MGNLSYVARRRGRLLEIEFSQAISHVVRDGLKELGFRYHFYQHLWYGSKHHDDALRLCELAVKRSAEATEKKADSLCWSCDKSGYGCTSKCPWERSWQPVPGWDADYNEKSGGYGVKACPLYNEMDVTKDRLAQAAVWW